MLKDMENHINFGREKPPAYEKEDNVKAAVSLIWAMARLMEPLEKTAFGGYVGPAINDLHFKEYHFLDQAKKMA